jgi:hypothetical protein
MTATDQIYNGTIMLICSEAFNKPDDNSLALGLGLGLGLGIPALCVFGWGLYNICLLNNITTRFGNATTVATNPPPLPTISPRSYVLHNLSEASFATFCLGILTPELKKELITLRKMEGRDLTECVQLAENMKNADLAHFIAQLNPTTIYAEEHSMV